MCRAHGGAAPQIRAAAKRRLEEASDRISERLIGMAESDTIPAYVSLQAVNSVLDRAGIVEPKEANVNVSVRPYEQVLDSLVGGSRSEYRASVGRPDPEPLPAPVSARADVLDVDVIDTEPDSIAGDSWPTGEGDDARQGDKAATESLGNAPLALPGGKPGYLDTETALSQARAANAKRQKTRRR